MLNHSTFYAAKKAQKLVRFYKMLNRSTFYEFILVVRIYQTCRMVQQFMKGRFVIFICSMNMNMFRFESREDIVWFSLTKAVFLKTTQRE